MYAAGILRGRRDRYHRTGFAIAFVPAAVLTPFQIFVGDTAARAIASDQPVKFAAMEYVPQTSRHVPEWLGGIYVNGHIYAGLKIPYMDSLLVGFAPGTQVTGWDSVPPAGRPPAVWLIHLCFDAMVGLGFLLLLAGLWARTPGGGAAGCPGSGCSGCSAAVSGVAAIVAMECGWVVTEVGRQPWVVYQILTTAQAATTNGGVVTSLTLIIVLYAVLGVARSPILRMLARRWRRGDAAEGRRPYGPPPAARRGRARRPGGVVMAAAPSAAILLACVTLYAVLGGADFGGGLWDLLAGGTGAGSAPRAADRRVDHPGVGGQPRLARLRSGHLLDRLPARVRRGDDRRRRCRCGSPSPGSCCAGRASRSARKSPGPPAARLAGAAFAFSSLLTPFFMGTVIGAIATGPGTRCRRPRQPVRLDQRRRRC